MEHKKVLNSIILAMFLFCTLFGCAKTQEKELVSTDETEASYVEIQNNSESNSVDATDKDDATAKIPVSEQDTTRDTVTDALATDSSSENTNYSTSASSDASSQVQQSKSDESNTYIVTFKDYDGTVLKRESVEKGKNATPPEEPTREKYQFIKWDTVFENVKTNITVTAIYEEITEATIIVGKAEGSVGDSVSVAVSVLNNPGLLGLSLNIKYDENAMKLLKIENGTALEKYTFTSPKGYKTGCNVAWSITDVPDGMQNGTLMLLHFEVIKNAKPGKYVISVSCMDDAFDSEYRPVNFRSIEGRVSVT